MVVKRLVKLHFKPEKCAEFEDLFARTHDLIRAFPGCLRLELWRDTDQNNLFFTISEWENEQALEAYRNSELFRSVWPRTKALFLEKAEAWSLVMLRLRSAQEETG